MLTPSVMSQLQGALLDLDPARSDCHEVHVSAWFDALREQPDEVTRERIRGLVVLGAGPSTRAHRKEPRP